MSDSGDCDVRLSGPDPAELGDSELDGDFCAARPQGDEIAREKVRAQIGEQLFGTPVEPVKLGRFVILDRLGQGGMGVVYSAYDPHLDRRVALKLLRAGTGRGKRAEWARGRLLREAQVLARLSHPNIVPVHDVGLLDEQVFIVMEFVVGDTLRSWVQDRERSWQDIVGVYCQAGTGLAAAHELGLVHRDFKPENVIVGDDGRVRVLDFGLARGLRPEELDESLDATIEETIDEGAGDDPALPIGRAADQDQAVDYSIDRTVQGDVELAARLEHTPELRGTETTEMADGRAARSDSRHRLDAGRTVPGTMMGTPRYMSPEHFAGRGVGPAADQFSFCVALYEALYGQRPFAGADFDTLRDNVRAGRIRDTPRGSNVPRWVQVAVCRGLEVRREDRYSSMNALLAALGRNPARAWRRRLIAAAFAALAIFSSYTTMCGGAGKGGIEVCRGGGQLLAQVWNEPRRAQVERAVLRTGHPYAEVAWGHIERGIDDYGRDWRQMHHDACMAHQRGEQSGDLLDKRMTCLERRRRALEATIDVFTAEKNHKMAGRPAALPGRRSTSHPQPGDPAGSPAHLVQAVKKLPSIDYCANTEAVEAEVPPPEITEVAERVEPLRDRLSEIRALEDAGHYRSGLGQIKALLERVETLGHEPLLAETLLVRGRIERAMRTENRGIESFRRAAHIGLRAGMNRLAVEAVARLLNAEATRSEQRASAMLELVPFFESLTGQVRNPTFVYPLLLNNTGTVYLARRDRDRARAFFERAMRELHQAPDMPLELTIVPSNLAMVTPPGDQRTSLFEYALAQREDKLGPEHPESLLIRLMYSHYTVDVRRAGAILAPACQMYQRYHPEQVDYVGQCLYYLGFLTAELGERDRAAGYLVRAARVTSRIEGIKQLAQGYVHYYRGEYENSLSMFRAVLERLSAGGAGWWVRQRLADARLGMGLSWQKLGRNRAAIDELERALATFRELTEADGDVEGYQRLAATRVALATALLQVNQTLPASSARPPGRAGHLITEAEMFYRQAGDGYKWRLDELTALRRAYGIGR